MDPDTQPDLQRIGSYRVVRQIGVGGMGRVFEGVQDQIERRAAIKVLHPDIAKLPELAQRFINEARAANLVRHPGIVEVYELGQLQDGAPYIVMEYLEGESLKARIKRLGTQLADEAPRLCRQIASALAAAHKKGIVHRDLKPDNLMIIADPEVQGGERVKVLDFGIAKLAEEHRRDQPGDPDLRTRTGITMGTPTYMAPEQCKGAGSVDDKADVYSLGVILYQLLVGRPPFQGGEGQILGMHLFVEPPPIFELAPWVGEGLGKLVHRMLAKEPAGRPTMAEVAAALTEVDAARPPEPSGPSGPSNTGRLAAQAAAPARPPGRQRRAVVLFGGAAVLVLCSGVILALRAWPQADTAAQPARDLRAPRDLAAARDSLAPAPPDLSQPPTPDLGAPAAPARGIVNKATPTSKKGRKGDKASGEDITNAKVKFVD